MKILFLIIVRWWFFLTRLSSKLHQISITKIAIFLYHNPYNYKYTCKFFLLLFFIFFCFHVFLLSFGHIDFFFEKHRCIVHLFSYLDYFFFKIPISNTNKIVFFLFLVCFFFMINPFRYSFIFIIFFYNKL